MPTERIQSSPVLLVCDGCKHTITYALGAGPRVPRGWLVLDLNVHPASMAAVMPPNLLYHLCSDCRGQDEKVANVLGMMYGEALEKAAKLERMEKEGKRLP